MVWFVHGLETGIGSLNENFGVVVDVASAVLKFYIGVGGLKLNCTLSCGTHKLKHKMVDVGGLSGGVVRIGFQLTVAFFVG